jgi:3-oxo-5-alpha-steroid 4-dehydrogenase 3
MASLDAAAAEFAAKALGTFWTLFFAASVVADLDLLPGVSARLRAFAARGKQADAEPSSPSAPAGLRAEAKWWVPHKWFAHFYVVGIACNAFVLAHALAEPLSAEHAAATLASCLFQAHVIRRFLETAFVARHRAGARMHIVGYLVGVVYYVAAPMTLATPQTTRAVCATFRVALQNAVAGDSPFARSRKALEAPPLASISIRSKETRPFELARALVSLAKEPVSPVSVARVSRVAFGTYAFLFGSVKQARCHLILAKLRETPSRTSRSAKTRKEDGDGASLSTHPEPSYAPREDPPTSHYAVPRGDWFESVSSPHYTAECLLYAGLALVAGARLFSRIAPMLAAIVANLALAARRTHAWYLETFPEYPKNRWAMVPGLV